MRSAKNCSLQRRLLAARSIIAAFAFLIVPAVLGQNSEKLATARTRITNSTEALKAITQLPAERSIPQELLARARVIAVFPNITKTNLLVAKGMKGSGLAALRTKDGWGTPVFYQFGMVDKGWTTVESKSPAVVILFMSDEAFKKEQIDISNTIAGPVGASIPDADKTRFEGVQKVAYGLGNGKLIGVKIEESDSIQSNMGADNGMNKPIFGKKGSEVLWATPPADLLSELKDLQAAMADLSKPN